MGSKAIYAGIAALVGAIAAFMAVSQFLPKSGEQTAKQEPAPAAVAAPTPAPAPVQEAAAAPAPAPVAAATPRRTRNAAPAPAPVQEAVVEPAPVAPTGPTAEQLAERIRLALFRETRCPGVQQSLMVINTATQGEAPQNISQALAILSARYDLCAAVSGGIGRAMHLANALHMANYTGAGAGRYARSGGGGNDGGTPGGGDNGGGNNGGTPGGGTPGGGGDTGGGNTGGGDTGGGGNTGGGGTNPGDVGGGGPTGGDGGPGYLG